MNVDQLNARAEGRLAGLVGLEVLEASQTRIRGALMVRPESKRTVARSAPASSTVPSWPCRFEARTKPWRRTLCPSSMERSA